MAEWAVGWRGLVVVAAGVLMRDPPASSRPRPALPVAPRPIAPPERPDAIR